MEGDLEGAKHALDTALLLQPKVPTHYSNLALAHFYAGDPGRAIELLSQAVRLSPRTVGAFALLNMGRAHFMLGDDKGAIDWLLKAADANPGWAISHAYLASALASQGDRVRSQAAAAALLRVDPHFSLAKFEKPEPWSPPAYQECWKTKLLPATRLAGLPE